MLFNPQALVHALEEPKTELALRTALSALMSLDLEGSVLSHLVARSEGVRALLAVCLEARATAVRVMALRAMTVVCCMSETIRQFEQVRFRTIPVKVIYSIVKLIFLGWRIGNSVGYSGRQEEI